MTRAHLYRPLQDTAGNLQRGATVRLLRPGTATLIEDPIYTGPDGVERYTQPIACPTGFLDAYFDLPVRVRVGVTPFGGGTEVFFEDIDPDVPAQSARQTPLEPVERLEATEVQSAISELQRNKYGTDTPLPERTAQQTIFEPAGTLGSANVQFALEELDEDAQTLTGRVTAAEDVNTTQDGLLLDHGTRLGVAESELVAHDGRLDTVEAAVPAVDLRVTNHLADEGDSHDASSVSVVPTGGITSADVQSALAELDTEVQAHDGRLDTLESAPPPAVNAFKSTFSPGLPTLAGRATGDLHYDETAKQEYVLTGAPGGVITSDNFNRSGALGGSALSGDPSKTWTDEYGGAWSANGSVATATGNTQILHTNLLGSDGEVTVRLASLAGRTGVTFRLSDRSNYWYLILNSGATGLDLTKEQAGGGSTTSYTTALAVGDIIGVRLAGSTIEVLRNGVVIGTRTDGFNVTATRHGLWSGAFPAAGSLDDFSYASASTLAWTSTDQFVAPHTHNQVQPFAVRTASRTLAATDGIEQFNGTDLTATLPTPVGRAGAQFTIKNVNATNLTVATTAGTIDADTTRILAQYDAMTVVSDGTNWSVI